jgi:hypothetical protein
LPSLKIVFDPLEEAKQLREQAALLPPGKLKEVAIRQARQKEAFANMHGWMASDELKPPN